jgi:hypothetical protein
MMCTTAVIAFALISVFSPLLLRHRHILRYTLSIDGKALEEFVDERKKTTKSWSVTLGGAKHLVAIGGGKCDVWAGCAPPVGW